jgi:hypothetical protein
METPDLFPAEKSNLPALPVLDFEKLNQVVVGALVDNKVQLFTKAYAVSQAITELQTMLTTEYMKPIMALQGNTLGFRTDKDKESGYHESVVKNCVIAAVLRGLQPVGNQFNIIAGRDYTTIEGFGFLLSKVPNLRYKIIPKLPNMRDKDADIILSVSWSFDGWATQESAEVQYPVRVNAGMGADAVIGKATRKARKWLFEQVTGLDYADGDATTDVGYKEVKETLPGVNELKALLEDKKTSLSVDELKGAYRVLNNQETNSYKKLHNFLLSK